MPKIAIHRILPPKQRFRRRRERAERKGAAR
jgi:hypothetical protein